MMDMSGRNTRPLIAAPSGDAVVSSLFRAEQRKPGQVVRADGLIFGKRAVLRHDDAPYIRVGKSAVLS